MWALALIFILSLGTLTFLDNVVAPPGLDISNVNFLSAPKREKSNRSLQSTLSNPIAIVAELLSRDDLMFIYTVVTIKKRFKLVSHICDFSY